MPSALREILARPQTARWRLWPPRPGLATRGVVGLGRGVAGGQRQIDERLRDQRHEREGRGAFYHVATVAAQEGREPFRGRAGNPTTIDVDVSLRRPREGFAVTLLELSYSFKTHRSDAGICIKRLEGGSCEGSHPGAPVCTVSFRHGRGDGAPVLPDPARWKGAGTAMRAGRGR